MDTIEFDINKFDASQLPHIENSEFTEFDYKAEIVDKEISTAELQARQDDILNKRMKYLQEPRRGQSGPWTDEQLERWRRHMGYKPLDVIKNTLDKTTQLEMVEEDNPSLNQMRRHYKKRLPFNNCRYINDVTYADVMHSGKRARVTIEDDDLVLIICFREKNIFGQELCIVY